MGYKYVRVKISRKFPGGLHFDYLSGRIEEAVKQAERSAAGITDSCMLPGWNHANIYYFQGGTG